VRLTVYRITGLIIFTLCLNPFVGSLIVFKYLVRWYTKIFKKKIDVAGDCIKVVVCSLLGAFLNFRHNLSLNYYQLLMTKKSKYNTLRILFFLFGI